MELLFEGYLETFFIDGDEHSKRNYFHRIKVEQAILGITPM